jgi:uncharacterized membrane protein
MVQFLSAVALIGCGLVTGVFFAVLVSVLPTLYALPAGQYVRTHQLLGRGYHPAMPLIVNAATLAELALAVISSGERRVLSAVAFVALIGVQFVSHLCNVPINRRVHGVDPDALPPGWEDPRPPWRAWHRVRTVLAAVALLATTVAAVLP